MRSLHESGFTLIEMVIVIVILAILAGIANSILTEGLTGYIQGENIVTANWQGQVALQRMSREIRLINSSNMISTMTGSNLAFTNINSDTVAFSLSGTSLTLTLNGNSQILADGIQSLTFSYFDKNGTSTAINSAVRYITLSINVTYQNANYVLTTSIYPRNFS